MNKKQWEDVILGGVLWCFILFGVGLYGFLTANSVALLLLWGLFMFGDLLLIGVIDKYIIFELREGE